MDRLGETSRSLGRLWVTWWERAIAWLREIFGLNKQRPSPLKELKSWRT